MEASSLEPPFVEHFPLLESRPVQREILVLRSHPLSTRLVVKIVFGQRSWTDALFSPKETSPVFFWQSQREELFPLPSLTVFFEVAAGRF